MQDMASTPAPSLPTSVPQTPAPADPLPKRVALWRGVDVALMSAGVIGLVIVGTLILTLVFGRRLGIRQNAARPSVEFTLAVLALEFGAIMLSVWLLGLVRRGIRWADIGFVRTSGYWVARAIGLFVALRIIVIAIVALLAALGFTSTQAQALAPNGFSWVGAIGNSLLAGILVPIAEETFFRGVLYRWLRDKWGMVAGALISGLIFGAAHFEPATVVPAILLGVVLALVYERSRSLWPSIIIHALNNLSAVILLYALLGAGVRLPK